jgi:hypothetical protein
MDKCTPECCSLEYHQNAKVKSDDDPNNTCPWWINSKDHDNHFKIYLLDKSNADGSMPELTVNQIGRLMGWPPAKAQLMWNEAFKELSDKMIQVNAKDLIKASSGTIEIPFAAIEANYTSDSGENE